jgi:hypothetical protein
MTVQEVFPQPLYPLASCTLDLSQIEALHGLLFSDPMEMKT